MALISLPLALDLHIPLEVAAAAESIVADEYEAAFSNYYDQAFASLVPVRDPIPFLSI